MARLAAPAYLDHLSRDSRRFREVLAATSPDARVPGCPDWSADDLLWHLTEVQWFWSQIVEHRPAGPPEQRPDRPSDHDELLTAFDDASSGLLSALATADPGDRAWTWSTEQTVGFTLRRQAHEALIHRLDAEQTAGAVTPLPADLATDGVAELVEVMYGGDPPAWATFTPSGRRVALVISDTRERLVVATGHVAGRDPESGTFYDGPHLVRLDDGRADATVAGTAEALDAWLWRRRDDSGITVTGRDHAYAEFRAAVDQPLD